MSKFKPRNTNMRKLKTLVLAPLDVTAELRVFHFEYDGMIVKFPDNKLKPVDYTAVFKCWNERDPGLGFFVCSDKRVRAIPSIAINRYDLRKIPKGPAIWMNMPKQYFMNGVLIGVPCSSRDAGVELSAFKPPPPLNVKVIAPPPDIDEDEDEHDG